MYHFADGLCPWYESSATRRSNATAGPVRLSYWIIKNKTGCVPNFEHMIWHGDFDFVLHFQASDNAERARLAAAKVSSMLVNYLGGAPLSRAEVLDRPYDRAF